MKKQVHVAVAILFAVAVAGCGSDDDSASSTEPPSTEASVAPESDAPAGSADVDTSAGPADTGSPAVPADGEPIKIMAMGQLQAESFSFPEIETGALAAVEEINESGGVGGRPLEVIICNDESDPNIAAACAREAANEGVVALVGGVSLYTNDVFPILEEAGIATIGQSPLNTAAETSSLSFPVDANASHFAAEGSALVDLRGCTKVGVLYADNDTATKSSQFVIDGIEAAGGEVVESLAISDTTPDITPAISTLIDAGAECFGTAVAPATLVQLVTAVRASSVPDAPIATTIGSLPLAIVEPLGAAAEGLLAGTNMFVSTDPVWADATARMEAVTTETPVATFGLLTYSAVHTFAELANAIDGEITAESVAAQAAKTSEVDAIGYPAPVDWTKPGPVASAPRLFNTNVLMYEIKDGTYSLVSPEPVDVTSVLAG
jgi:ABC-type branched-subunit amino acid transport system substrate-binding protein